MPTTQCDLCDEISPGYSKKWKIQEFFELVKIQDSLVSELVVGSGGQDKYCQYNS